jgi:hypothetical protein
VLEPAEVALIGGIAAGSYAFIRRAVSAEVRALEKKVGLLEQKVGQLDERNDEQDRVIDQQDRVIMGFKLQMQGLARLLRRIIGDIRSGRSADELAAELDDVVRELDELAKK